MTLYVTNTLSGEKEKVVPRNPGRLDMYICGITPYSDTHLGHARPSVFWDTVRRYLEYRGWRVFVVQNVTDVNEKVLARAQLEGISERELAERYHRSYEELMRELGVKPADVIPWVSDHMDQIIESIGDLLDNGHAYEVDGDVYFDVTSYRDYGRLSGQSLEDLRAGARLSLNEKKNHPADFALWKATDGTQPSWDSPWGRGRPGWHIECSAMSRQYLGFGFDIHAGGSDLVFPHHENERAQSESLSECDGVFSRYWVHHGMVRGDDGKMSKSLGNFVTVEELLQEYRPEVLRLFLLGAHYSKPLTFSEERLEESLRAWVRLARTVENLDDLVETGVCEFGEEDAEDESGRLSEMVETLNADFCAAMDDDLNTAKAIAAVFEAIRDLNTLIHVPNLRPTVGLLEQLQEMRDQLEICSRILGVWPETRQSDEREDDAGKADLLELLLEVREKARESKAFDLADHIRDGLVELGYAIEDTPDGPRVRRDEGG
ncbi:MAG: cysteine--tRNA ligase [Clostridia bacterium]